MSVLVVVALPVDESSTPTVRRIREAQALVDALSDELGIGEAIIVVPVVYHPFVFAVEPAAGPGRRFELSIEMGFLGTLTRDELRAALAHELGHVWIFTHHPYLQTERLANDIGRKVVDRESLVSLYRKLWFYEGSAGVPIEALVGPDASGAGKPAPTMPTDAPEPVTEGRGR